MDYTKIYQETIGRAPTAEELTHHEKSKTGEEHLRSWLTEHKAELTAPTPSKAPTYLEQVEAAAGAPIKFTDEITQYIRVPGEAGGTLKALRTEAELARATQEGTVKRGYVELPQEAKGTFTMGGEFYPEVKGDELPTSEDLGAGIGGEAPEVTGIDSETLQTYQKGLTQAVDTKKKDLNTAYDTEITKTRDEISNLQKDIANIEAKIGEEGTVTEEIKKLSEPFREQLRQKQEKELELLENYEANQKTISELESMANELQGTIDTIRGKPASAMVTSGRIADAKETYQARASILQATISARDGQMSRARIIINDAIADIEADRQDQLTYYQNIWNYYSDLKDEKGNRIITLDEREQGYIKDKIAILEDDLKTARGNADYITGLMLDPNTASLMESAGVSLTDSPTEVNSKIAQANYEQEQIDLKNKYEDEGYDYLGSGSKSLVDIYTERTDLQKAYPNAMVEGSDDQQKLNDWWNTYGKKEYPDIMLTGGVSEDEIMRIKDSKGKELIFRKPEAEIKPEVRELMLQYPTAGITTANSMDVAINKAMKVASEEQKLDLEQKRATLARTWQLAAGGGEEVITVGQMLGLPSSTASKFDTDLEQEINKVYTGKYGKAGAREQALTNLQLKYPGIADSIADVIYGSDEFNAIFPDGYETKIKEAGEVDIEDILGG